MALRKGKGVYKGTHWTQQPENKARLVAMNSKAGKKNRFKAIAKQAVRQTKPKRSYVKKAEATTLVVNGWRVTLGNGEIRIDHE